VLARKGGEGAGAVRQVFGTGKARDQEGKSRFLSQKIRCRKGGKKVWSKVAVKGRKEPLKPPNVEGACCQFSGGKNAEPSATQLSPLLA